ncbi:LysR substrate-binding domain-containing protein [Muricoccus nepalensis]|uniref:LysR substrate-binding domain-containing protein n=1 Tax=Muricoccus nepalensis TaxID=1854500 RepID=UPI001F4F441B|nr:LysR substrate-binding domain-containing protein [Roseomonas nepalensis]
MVHSMLPALLGRIARSHRNILLEIRPGRSPFLIEELERGELDLAITTPDRRSYPRLVRHRSPTAWFCGADFAHRRDAPLFLVLSNEPLRTGSAEAARRVFYGLSDIAF